MLNATCNIFSHGNPNRHIPNGHQADEETPRRYTPSGRAGVRKLEDWPDVRNVKPLQGIKGFRLRSGRYRVLFDVDENGKIFVAEVLIRNESTY